MHQSILETRHVVLSQPAILQQIIQSTSPYGHQFQSIVARLSVPWHPGQQFSEPFVHSFFPRTHDIAETFQRLPAADTENYQKKARGRNDKGQAGFQSRESFVTCKPASSFEVSSNFFPETFTTDQRLPTFSLILTGAKETRSSIRSRTNIYNFLYLRSPRRWLSVDISMEFTPSSRYWTVAKLSQHQRLFSPGFIPGNPESSLPKSLLEKIQDYLLRADENDLVNVQHYLSTKDTIEKHQSKYLEIPCQSPIMTMKLSNIDPCILEFLDDLGCQQFEESEVVQVKTISPPTRFASLVDGVLVLEIKFIGDCLRFKDLYEIQVLRGMDGVPGFSKLVGIVLDRSRKRLRSYLVKVPQSKWDFISDLVTDTSVIPWERRQNLARQVVEAVQQLHSKSFVIGTLWRQRQPIIVDIFDRVQFWTFDKQFVPYSRSRSCCYPPEYAPYLHATLATSEAGFPQITPKADIYILGMTLWYLAMGYPKPKLRQGPSEDTKDWSAAFDLHSGGFIVLPPLPERIPKYYRDIVNECRSIDPSKRPSARSLLERFTTNNSEQSQIGGSGLGIVDLGLQSMERAFLIQKWCGLCIYGVQGSAFHCDICHDGDFDICLNCYSQGHHCDDEGHMLAELVQRESRWVVSGRYYSVVRNSGARDFTICM